MKKFFKPACLLLYLLTIVVFFFVGASFVGITGMAKNQGLAGGAIVFFYAVNFSFFALIASILMVHRFSHAVIIKANKLLSILLIVLIVVFTYLFLQRKKARAENSSSHQFAFVQGSDNADDVSMGMGLFYPSITENNVLYFYGNPNISEAVIEHPPIDSIVFYKTEHGNMDISYAPPWLVPEHLKLDYDIIYFKVLSISSDFAEVVVNSTNSQVAYVSRYAGTVSLWPEFLLGVYSVEFISETERPLLIKPLSHASEVNIKYDIMKPKVIKDDWMQVELFSDDFVSVGFGWVKWKDGPKHLLRYSLLC
ncbi:MAG TPA: hypothetical protein PKM97_07695 [Bacteroidia bacterium]|nr:hypothetical protein [Bacteroidia bacterium]